TSGKSFGPNYLIKDGAKLVQTWRDIVEEFPIDVKGSILAGERDGARPAQPGVNLANLSDTERRVLHLINVDEAVQIDRLISRSGMSTGDLMGALLKLEMSDRIRQLPGKSFVRKL